MTFSHTRRWLVTGSVALAAAAVVASGPASARQAPAASAAPAAKVLTDADYARAEQFMPYNTTSLVLRSGVRPVFLPDGRFWYRITTEKGSEALLVDPIKATKVACTLPACAEGAGGGRGARSPRGPGGGRLGRDGQMARPASIASRD